MGGPFMKGGSAGTQVRKSPTKKRLFKPADSKPAKPATIPPRPGPRPTIAVSRMPKPTVAPVRAPSVSGKLSPVERSDPHRLRVFILGDSQSLTSFGPELQKRLVEGGYEVLFHGVKNGTPYFWEGAWPSPVLTRIFSPAATPEACGQFTEVSMQPRSIAEYVEAFDPDVFVFQAGTNFEIDLVKENVTEISRMIRESVRVASMRGARVLWIGPPDARDDVKAVAMQVKAGETLRQALFEISASQTYECFFDSRPVCPIGNDSGGDGEHPTHSGGIAWAVEAAEWVEQSIDNLNCDGLLRPPGGTPISPTTRLFTRELGDSPPALGSALPMKLQLVAKSDPGDVSTLTYTDAFSVYQYQLLNGKEIHPDLTKSGIAGTLTTLAGDPAGIPVVYVLHWAIHNNGSGPRATGVSARRVGETFDMRVCPLASHPLGKVLGTMVQFNDFDDFTAPVFLAENFLEERAHRSSP